MNVICPRTDRFQNTESGGVHAAQGVHPKQEEDSATPEAPAATKDAVLLVTLPPGPYSARVSGVGASAGIAIIEVYELP